MTLLLALVLGLLIWTAYGVFSTQKASVQTLAATDLKLAEAFQDYGPEAAEGQNPQGWDQGYDRQNLGTQRRRRRCGDP